MKWPLLILLCLSGWSSFAQNEPDAKPKKSRDFWDRIYIGGNLNINFGTVTILGGTPQIGYRITDNFVAGIGATYIYYSQNIPNYGRFETSIYGGNIFARHRITENIFAHTEYHILNVEGWTEQGIERTNVPLWYVGGGYLQPIGDNTSISIMVLIDLIDDINSPYSNPLITGGFNFGF
jgi:hypothetical protein